MASSWQAVVPIVDGEAVKAGTPNRPLLQLAARTQYLYEQLQLVNAGSALIKRAVALASDVEVGDAVYFEESPTGGEPVGYHKAIAEADSSSSEGVWFASKRSEVAGVVLSVNAGAVNTGDIVTSGSLGILGYLTLAGKTLNDLVDTGSIGSGGQYYLSSSIAGKFSKSRTVLSAYIGSLSVDGNITVNPNTSGSNRDHTHFMHELVATPAGDTVPPATTSDPHVITSPAPASPGWLPATIAYFPAADFVIPPGAVFGYNINHASEASLRNNFPPVPIDFYYIEKDGVGLDQNTVVVNETGIWWMNDTYGQAPWPADYDTGAPDLKGVDIKLWITKMNMTNGLGQVATLAPDTSDSTRIPIESFNGDAVDSVSAQSVAVSGIVKLATAKLTSSDTVVGDGKTIRSISGSTLQKVASTSKIIPGPGVEIIATHGDSTAGFYGEMTLGIAGTIGAVGQASLIVLNNSREDVFNGIHYLNLPQGYNSSVRFKVKAGQLPGTPGLKMRLSIYGRGTGTIPNLGFKYRILSLPDVGSSSIPAASDTVLADIAGAAIVSGQVITLESATIPSVPAGAIVFIEVSRTSADAYASDVAIIDASYIYGV